MTIRLFQDPNGREVVAVPLINFPHGTAQLYREDYERIVALYDQRRWSLMRVKHDHGRRVYHYVRMLMPIRSKSQIIARLVAPPGEGKFLGYWDDNPLNLRSDNLMMKRNGTEDLFGKKHWRRLMEQSRILCADLPIPPATPAPYAYEIPTNQGKSNVD